MAAIRDGRARRLARIAAATLLLALPVFASPASALQSAVIGSNTSYFVDLDCPNGDDVLYGVIGYITDHITGLRAMCAPAGGGPMTQDEAAGSFSGAAEAAANCAPSDYVYAIGATVNKSNGQMLGLQPLCGAQASNAYATIGNMSASGDPKIALTKVACGPGYAAHGLTVWTADAARQVLVGFALKCQLVPPEIAVAAVAASDFAGDWTLTIGSTTSAMHLDADASGIVSGTYDSAGANGVISNGSVNGRIMQLNWSEASGHHGGGGLQMDSDGQQLYGNRFDADGTTGPWSATRGLSGAATSASGGGASSGGASAAGAPATGSSGTPGTMAQLSGENVPTATIDISTVARAAATAKTTANIRQTASSKGAKIGTLPANTPVECLALDPATYGAYLGGGAWCAVEGDVGSQTVVAWIANSLLDFGGGAAGGAGAGASSSSGGSSSGSGSASGSGSFSAFQGAWIVSLAGTPPFSMEFHQSGSTIAGSYVLANGPGTISGGSISGGTLSFLWSQNGFTGKGNFTPTGAGGLTGTFVFDSGGPSGTWSAHR